MRLIWTIIFGISALNSFSQSHLLGIKGGVLFSNSSPDYDYNEKSYKSSFTGGITYDFQFKKTFVLSTEILYSQYGFETKTNFFISGTQTEIAKNYYNYISLPVKAGIMLGSRLSGFFNLGVAPSFLISAKSESKTQYWQETIDLSSNVNKLDIIIIFELGGDIKLNKNLLLFSSVNYQHSLRNIEKSDIEVLSNSQKNFKQIPGQPLKHFGISISFGLKFKLNT